MNTTMKERGEADRPADRRQGRRLDEIAWALVLIMTGALWLAPKAMFPEGTWLAGLGLIVLALNAVRRIRGIDASGFGIAVGVVALAAGASRMAGFDLPLVPVLMVVLGIVLVAKAAVASGKNEGASSAR
ncbi:MAG TPA: hypothetical protein VLJ16_08825 [Acidobacteriota bacterium]|nr:hypothetical protein [Acidobacteriota bacterium]